MEPRRAARTETSAPRHAEIKERLLALVRPMPPSELRLLLDELDGLLAHPSCADAPADGVACSSAQSSCEDCARARTVLEAVRRRRGLA